MAAKRFACALIPDFELGVQLLAQPALASQPAALAQGQRAQSEILMRNDKAAPYGVEPGMTVAQGKALCPDLVTTVPNPTQSARVSQKNLKLLQNLSPYVEEEAPGCYFLDAAGLTRLYQDERTLAQRVLALLKTQRFTVTVGIADTTTAAKVAAEISRPHTFTLIPAGADQRFLASRSIDHLDPSAETRWRLHALGLRTAEQIRSIPENDLVARLGVEGKTIAGKARGADPRHFDPVAPTEPLARTVVFQPPLFGKLPIIRHAEQLLRVLFERIQSEGRACFRATVVLSLEDRTVRTIPLAVHSPSRSLSIFLRQLSGALDRASLAAAVTELTITLTETDIALSEQFDLGGQAAQRLTADPSWLATLAVRSEAHFLTADPAQGILPEHHARLIPHNGRHRVSATGASTRPPAYAASPIAGLRLLAPPRRTRVAVARRRPCSVVIARHEEKIAQAEGPWELSGSWWEFEFDRRYYEIETMRHHRYLIYMDRPSSHWFLQGIFD